MPIYEYSCEKCGAVLEITQRMADPPLEIHNGAAKCGGKLTKLMSSNSFHLKGTGWYKTDYATPSKADSKKEQGESTGDGKEKSASDKPAEKKETSKAEASD